ncbi:MAG: hypothetical protein LBU91_01110 [Bacteroidales bacterium]|jgi:hypothetical protein|nr:hypothetical protein [Bacteroidales bacterium]
MPRNRVLATPEVKQYLNNLIFILHKKEYFGFRESAREYVIELIKNITGSLPRHSYKSAPEYFDRYGKDMHYATFKKNKQTSWYVFFTKYLDNGETIYLIRYIANNHTVAQYL